MDSDFEINISRTKSRHFGSGQNHPPGGILIPRAKQKDSPRMKNGFAVIFDNGCEYPGGGKGKPPSLFQPSNFLTRLSILWALGLC
jgi:hypothetical protein